MLVVGLPQLHLLVQDFNSLIFYSKIIYAVDLKKEVYSIFRLIAAFIVFLGQADKPAQRWITPRLSS
mgnify:CR=1 FL=1